MLLGPLFRFELVRLARRGTHLWLRVTLVLLLLLGLLSAYLKLFPGSDIAALLFGESADPSHLDKFGETFLVAFLIIQQAAVLLHTPVYAGGAIAEEKEKGRLDFLLTSPLGRWELVFGKLAARLVYVLAIVLTGLPVLSLTLLFGGVSPDRVLAGFVVAVVSTIAVGSFSVVVSVFRPTLRDVLLWVFGGLTASGLFGLLAAATSTRQLGGLVSPVTVLIPLFNVWNEPPATGDPTWVLVGVYAGLYLTLSAVCVLVAVANVRTAATRLSVSPVSVAPPPPEPTPLSPEPRPAATEPPPPDWYQVPTREVFSPDDIPSSAEGRGFLVPTLSDNENPLDWKERHFGGRLPLLESQWFTTLRGCAVAAFVCMLLLGLFIGVGMSLQSARGMGLVTRSVAAVVLVASMLGVPFAGVRAAASVAEERAKKTLESLFALPLDRSAVLWAKVRAAVRRSQWWAWGSAAAVALAALTGGLHPICIPGLGLMLAGYGVFAVGLGTWLGVRCKTTTRAVLTHLAITLVTLVGPVIVAPLFGQPLVVLSPPGAVFFAAVGTADDLTLRTTEQWAICLSVPVGLAYGVIGWIALQVARWRFERE